jgi:RHS repeat-associated protein
MTRLYNWHQGVGRQVAVYEPRYNERGLLFSEELVVRANRNSAANGKRYDEIPGQSRREQAIREIHYNEKGQKEYVVHGNSTITRYDYDPESFRLRQLRTTRPNYDPPFTGTHSGLVNPQVLQQLNYTYDPVGNITEIYDEAYEPVFFDNQQVNPVNQYIYDALYRLIQASGRENGAANGAPTQLEDPPVEVDFPIPSGALRNYTEAYRYDSAGNIHEMEHVGGSNGNWTRHYGYASDSNRLLRTWERANHWNDSNATNKIEYQYDTHGSMLNTNNVAPGQYLQWDHRDMIKSIDLVGGGIAYYQYDSGKQRTRKVIENNPGTGRWERIYLGGFELYRRYNSTSSQPVEEIETYHLFEGEQRLLLVDDVISTTKKHADGSPYITGPHFRYQYSNHLGSACLELDDQTEIISYEEYHPYGTSAYRAVKRNIEAPPKRYRYTGMERDEESGLSYHTARYYLSRLGRWVSVDSSGIEEGTNLYHFCSGEPIGRVDLNGNSDNSETKIVKPAMQKVLPKNTATEFQVRWTDPKTGITHVLRIDIAIPPQNELMCFDVFGEYKGTPKKSGKPSTQTEGQIPFHEAIKSPTGADVIVDSNKALPGSGFQNTKGKTANFQEGKNFVFIDNENVSQVQRGTADVYGTNKPGVKVRRAGESPAKPAQGNPVKPTPVAAVKSTTQTPPKPAAPAATVKPTTQTPPEPAAPAATVKPTTQATSKVAASTKPATLDAPANLPKGTGTKVKLTRTPGNSVTAPVAGGALVLMELMMDEDTKQGMGIACEMALLAIADRTHPGDPTQKYIEKIIRANKEPTLADKELLERHDIAFVGMKEGKAYWQIGGVIKRNVNIGF